MSPMNKLLRVFATILLMWSGPAFALNDTIAVTVGTGTTKTANLISFGTGNVISEVGICDATTANQCASVSAGGAVKVDGSGATQPVSGTVTANLGTLNGASTAAKQPALGTAGSASADVITIQGVASMTPLLATATLNAETAKVIGTVRNLGNAGAIFDGATGAAVPANVVYMGINNGGNLAGWTGAVTQATGSNLHMVCDSGCSGSGGTAIADKAAWTVTSTNATPMAGEFTTGGATACATAQACTVAMLADRSIFANMADWAGSPITGAVTAYGTAPTGNVPGFNTFVTNTNANGQATAANSSPVVCPVLTVCGAAVVKGGVPTVNGGSFYQAVAASQTAAVLQSSTGAAGDYLSHCDIYPTSTSPGVVTVFDNTNTAANSAILFAGGATSVSNLAPIPVPVGAVSVGGAWKVTTGANVSVACFGKFS